MKKDKFNQLFREYVKSNLSPTKDEQGMIVSVYDAFKTALGNDCLLVGSYARYTAIRPLHDLDILFIAGNFDPRNLNPQSVLNNLHSAIQKSFKNPTKCQTKISQQTHSITIAFIENGKEIFAVDVVPAFISGSKNEFGDDVYYVPEILNASRRNRQFRYDKLNKTIKNEVEWWLKSDPRGYIKVTTDLNSRNNDFRKTAKFIKRWKYNCKEKYEDFKLKSFHIEQVIFEIYKQNPDFEITDVIFRFFCDIPSIISKPKIKDRADQEKFIDDYLSNLTEAQKLKIIEARDYFLIELENFTSSKPISTLLTVNLYKRACPEEQYLFDCAIPTCIEDELRFKIDGKVLFKNGFRGNWWLSEKSSKVEIDRKIEFQIRSNSTYATSCKWKVKNDNSSPQPRGEITDNQTRNNPESTKYKGNHYVECYAIKNNVCIAKSRIGVII